MLNGRLSTEKRAGIIFGALFPTHSLEAAPKPSTHVCIVGRTSCRLLCVLSRSRRVDYEQDLRSCIFEKETTIIPRYRVVYASAPPLCVYLHLRHHPTPHRASRLTDFLGTHLSPGARRDRTGRDNSPEGVDRESPPPPPPALLRFLSARYVFTIQQSRFLFHPGGGWRFVLCRPMLNLVESASFFSSVLASGALQFFSRTIRVRPWIHKIVKLFDRGKAKVRAVGALAVFGSRPFGRGLRMDPEKVMCLLLLQRSDESNKKRPRNRASTGSAECNPAYGCTACCVLCLQQQ